MENDVLILGRHKNDIDEFLFNTKLVKKGRSKNYKKITNKKETIDNVEYRTIHKAKGLEADYVIIIRVIDDWMGFPNRLSIYPFMELIHDWRYEDKLKEERRLFYVALTRAKKGVYIFTRKNNESSYIDELKEDNLSNLEIIYTDDKSTYSHLKEFDKVKKPKKIKAKVKNKEINTSKLIDINTIDGKDELEIKAKLKKIGNEFIKSKDYYGAIDFYNKLLTNKYFLNDYYPYRKLVEVYMKKYDSKLAISTIKEFFKSGLYCNKSQVLWFKLKFKRACVNINNDFNQFYDYLDYYKKHGAKNKDKQNIPVPIAARIQIKRNQIKIISQKDFDKKSKIKELEYNYKFAKEFESYEKALYYYEQLWQQKEFKRNLTKYKKLCSLYYDTGQFEKAIEVANEYFKSNLRKTKKREDWFKNKIKKAESMLNNNSINKDNDLINSNNQCNVVTIESNNFSKLLNSNVGNEVTIRHPEHNFLIMKLKIVDIKNPNQKHSETKSNSKKVKIEVAKKEYNQIKKFDLISIKNKTQAGEIILKHS